MNVKSEKTAVKLLEIDCDLAGQRIDNFLITLLKPIPRSLVYRLLRTGQVRVNKGRVRPAYRLVEQDQVRIPPLDYQEKPDVIVPHNALLALDDITLYEDDHVLVINKPAGFAVHAGSGLRYGLIEALRQKNRHFASLELVHRLDRETSGCLLLAKHRRVLGNLHALMLNRKIDKTYTALLQGRLKSDEINVAEPLALDRLQSDERMVVVHVDGKPAETRIRLQQRYTIASLVNVQIPTGRKHQIRVHTAFIGHAIAGDAKYGDKDFNRQMRGYGLKRVFLHAARLSFQLDKKISVEAPLPSVLQQVLHKLEQERLNETY